MSRRGSSLNLNSRHPRIQTFSSFLDGPSDGTPKIYGTKTEETGNQAYKLGSRSGAHTQLDNWRGRRCWARGSHSAQPATPSRADRCLLRAQDGSPLARWECYMRFRGREESPHFTREYSRASMHLLPHLWHSMQNVSCGPTERQHDPVLDVAMCHPPPPVSWWTENRHQVTMEEAQQQRGRSQTLWGT